MVRFTRDIPDTKWVLSRLDDHYSHLLSLENVQQWGAGKQTSLGFLAVYPEGVTYTAAQRDCLTCPEPCAISADIRLCSSKSRLVAVTAALRISRATRLHEIFRPCSLSSGSNSRGPIPAQVLLKHLMNFLGELSITRDGAGRVGACATRKSHFPRH